MNKKKAEHEYQIRSGAKYKKKKNLLLCLGYWVKGCKIFYQV
jgi:hypothetical protein